MLDYKDMPVQFTSDELKRMKPIVIPAPMIQAVLEGQKTEERRPVTPFNKRAAKCLGYKQGDGLWVHGYDDELIAKGDAYRAIKDYTVSPCWIDIDNYINKYAPCKPGDILFVRETWGINPDDGGYIYRATDPGWDEYNTGLCWKPSTTMPREAARIFLWVKHVRVERLHDMNHPIDIKKEGHFKGCLRCTHYNVNCWDIIKNNLRCRLLEEFITYWNNKYSKHGYGWETNPWLFVSFFERILCS